MLLTKTFFPIKHLIYRPCCLLCNAKPIARKSLQNTFSTETLQVPQEQGADNVYPLKIQNIVNEISKLTLQEVVDLNNLLKKTLNIKDTPMMAYSAAPAAAPVEEEDDLEEKIQKTSFTVKLTKFDDTKKVALIKEIKSLVTGLNLVQAKKFVESCPQIVKADIGKTEAEELAEKIKLAGGTCEVV